jgi:hypothetical protein
MECAEMIDMTEEEINYCLSDNYSEENLLNEDEYTELKTHINNLRVINGESPSGIGNYENALIKLKNEINEGEITYIIRSYNSQIVTIKKRGVYYKLEVSGDKDCNMGTAKFDENNYDWQIVYVKESPYEDKYSAYYMRIVN